MPVLLQPVLRKGSAQRVPVLRKAKSVDKTRPPLRYYFITCLRHVNSYKKSCALNCIHTGSPSTPCFPISLWRSPVPPVPCGKARFPLAISLQLVILANKVSVPTPCRRALVKRILLGYWGYSFYPSTLRLRKPCSLAQRWYPPARFT